MYISLSGLGAWRDLAGKYRRRAEVARAFARSATNTIAREVESILTDALKAEAPVGQDRIDIATGETTPGGTLRDSIKAQIRVGAGGITVGFQAVDYAQYVIRDTPAHVIFPKSGNVLAFDIGGMTVFARSVEHPGTKANPFQQRALEQSRPAINAALRRAGKDLLVTFR